MTDEGGVVSTSSVHLIDLNCDVRVIKQRQHLRLGSDSYKHEEIFFAGSELATDPDLSLLQVLHVWLG